MEEGGEALHDEQDAHGQHGEGREEDEEQGGATEAGGAEAELQHHGPKDLRQLYRGGRGGGWKKTGDDMSDGRVRNTNGKVDFPYTIAHLKNDIIAMP